MQRDIHIVVERDEEGWLVGWVPSLPGCHTQARTIEELRERIHEAIEAYLDTEENDIAFNEFVGIEAITIGR